MRSTRVIEGAVKHLDSIFSDDERETADTMFICVSRAEGSRIVIEL